MKTIYSIFVGTIRKLKQMVQKSGSGKCGSIITISILLGSQLIYLFKDFGKKLKYLFLWEY